MDELDLGEYSEDSDNVGSGRRLLAVSRQEIWWGIEWIWDWGIRQWGTGENCGDGVSINSGWYAAVMGRWWEGSPVLGKVIMIWEKLDHGA